MKAKGLSLEWRIRRQLLAGLVLVLCGLMLIVHFSVTRLTEAFVVSRLETDAESLISALERNADGHWSFNEMAVMQPYQRVQSGHYYRLLARDLDVRSRSLWDLDPEVKHLQPGERQVTTLTLLPNQHWLALEQGFSRQGVQFTLWVAQDIADLKHDQEQMQLGLLLIVALSIPFLLLLQSRVLRHGFKRLEPLRQALARQQAGEDIALPEDVPKEVAPLVDSITQLLHQSGQQIGRSRMALGNLAHELKRPLQHLQWLAEQHPDPSQKQQLMGLYEELYRRIERELRRARIAGSPGPGRHFNPMEEIPHLVQLLQRIGRDDIEVITELPKGLMPFDRDDMLELLGNLLDNAWRHAHHKIKIRISQPVNGSSTWTLAIEDDGPGVTESEMQQMSMRGVRIDEQSGDGSGLGLSICSAIVDSYAGSMEFSRSLLGGLCIDVRLGK